MVQAHSTGAIQQTEVFVRAARAAAATVTCVPRQSDAICNALFEATRGARSIVMAESEYFDRTLFSRLVGGAVLQDANDDGLANADVGITGAFAGVASTGTVCVELGNSLTPAASLLMPLHVVLLPAEWIVNRPRDLFDAGALGGAGLTRNFVFVTGPSATADMGPLVRGVHGPHRLHIVILES